MTPTDDVRTQGVRVTVETVLLGVADTHLTFRVMREHLGDGDHPDKLARTLGRLHHVHTAGALLHSTSWRFGAGGVILTYAGLPDPDPHGAAVLGTGITVAASPDPLAPSPVEVDDRQVVAHACRHLAYLRLTDPLVADTATQDPQLWDLIDAHQPTVAGLLIQPPMPQFVY